MALATALAEVAELCRQKGACEDGQVYTDACAAKGMTPQQFVDGMADAVAEEWCSWLRTELADLLSAAVRLVFLERCARDPRIAAWWDVFGPTLSRAEKTLLRSRWHSQFRPDGQVILPVWERQLERREVLRKSGD